ncbi:MAG: amidohydrolase family protein [Gammaproteobacteria bacterium]
MTDTQYDTLIKNALVFDGSGELPVRQDVAVLNGVIAARAHKIEASADKVIEAEGLWLTPGLLDIHTHFDLEVELAPGLPEAVRHGTTTVVVSNCSLGLAYGSQRHSGSDVDPIVDCFARVENIPKPVLKQVADRATWRTSQEYLDHLNSLSLGVNIVPMIPHSMLRIEVMGFKDSVSRDPTNAELDAMKELLAKGMQEGYVGFSTDALPYHYLANDPNRRHKIPTQYGSYKELKLLTEVLRENNRVWQATPPKDSKLMVLRNFLLSSGRLHGKPLKLTAVAALDVVANRGLLKTIKLLSTILNSRLLNGRFAVQALAAPFKIWGEGPITPIFEEVDELRLLNEPDLEDREGRQAVLNDPDFARSFIHMWTKGKKGFGLARFKRLISREDYAFRRSLSDMYIQKCPVDDWSGLDLETIFTRAKAYRSDGYTPSSEQEKQCFDALPDSQCEGRFLLELLKQFDTDLYWHSVVANDNPDVTLDTLLDPKMLPGFNDSGAHLTNMAFYDANLRGLQSAMGRGLETVAYLVRRLTRDPAEFFNIEAGTVDVGARADITLIDPDKLQNYDSEATTKSIFRQDFSNPQLVNRSDGVVTCVLVAGHVAWEAGEFSSAHGLERWGKALTAMSSAT